MSKRRGRKRETEPGTSAREARGETGNTRAPGETPLWELRFVPTTRLMSQPHEDWKAFVQAVQERHDFLDIQKRVAGISAEADPDILSIPAATDNGDDYAPTLVANAALVVAAHSMDVDRLPVLIIQQADLSSALRELDRIRVAKKAEAERRIEYFSSLSEPDEPAYLAR